MLLIFIIKAGKRTSKNTSCEPETYRRNLLQLLDVLDKLIDERVLKYGELRLKEREVQAIKEIEKRLKEKEIHLQESLVTKGTTLEACLVTEGATLEACLVTEGIEMDDSLVAKGNTNDFVTSSEQLDESNNSGNDADADIRPSYDSDTMSEVYHEMFENMFFHGIQNHEQPESIPDTYVVNKNNSNIISDIPNMDMDRDKE
nr:hypothetical protein [Tanacetum cinerariifolium]